MDSPSSLKRSQAPKGACGFFPSLGLLLSVLPLVLNACKPAESPTTPPVLRIGMELGYPPFEMIDESGKPAGVSVEMAGELGRFLGREVVIENTAFDGLIPALQTGKIDLIISSMTANAERAKSIAFSAPYVRTGLAMLLPAASGIASVSELNRPDKKVAVKRGTTGHLYAMDHLREATLLVLDKENSAVLEVAQGKADAFIYDQLSIYRNWRANEAATRALLKPFQEEVWAVGLRQGDADLRQQVDEFLKTYRDAGGFEMLAKKFFSEERAYFQEIGTNFLF